MPLYGARKALFRTGAPAWVPRADGVLPTIFFDFTTNRARYGGRVVPAPSLVACTRAVSGTGHAYDYADDSNGVWYQFGANVPRITNKGLLVEENRTNVVLNNRDFTTASWSPTNITAAKDQVGVDGVQNAASSIVATSSNAIILQAITLASSARYQTAFVRRISGSGTIQMTMDGGSTWITVAVTALWSRVSIPTQTIANPSVGFKIVTNGDSIAVDAVQNENGTFATSPIMTTSVAVTRNADYVVMSPVPSVGTSKQSMFMEVSKLLGTPVSLPVYGGWAKTLTFSDGIVYLNSNTAQTSFTGNSVASANTGVTVGYTAQEINKFMYAYQDGANGAQSAANGVASSSVTGNATPTGPAAYYAIGSSPWNTGANFASCYVRRLGHWLTTRVSSAEMVRLTT